MTSRWIVAILIVGGVAAAVGCGSKCNTSCLGPGDYLYTPTGLASPLVDIIADPPCSARLWPADGGSTQVQVTDDATGTSACVLHAHLADGEAVTASITFEPAGSDACCPVFTHSGGEFTPSGDAVGAE